MNNKRKQGSIPRVSDTSFLSWLAEYHRKNGYAPSFREAAKALKVSSTSVASYRVSQLSRKGYVRRKPGVPRSMVITPLGYSALQGI